MKQIITTMTQRGQVTVPAEVRRMLGLKPRGKVAFSIKNGKVEIAAPRFTLESAYGSVKPPTPTKDFKELSRIARDEKAARDVRRLNRS